MQCSWSSSQSCLSINVTLSLYGWQYITSLVWPFPPFHLLLFWSNNVLYALTISSSFIDHKYLRILYYFWLLFHKYRRPELAVVSFRKCKQIKPTWYLADKFTINNHLSSMQNQRPEITLVLLISLLQHILRLFLDLCYVYNHISITSSTESNCVKYDGAQCVHSIARFKSVNWTDLDNTLT